jgi:hypothetical protein
MDSFEWVSNELRHYQNEERTAMERIKIAEAALVKAEADLSAAKDMLAEARGGIVGFTFQMKYLEEHGRLP